MIKKNFFIRILFATCFFSVFALGLANSGELKQLEPPGSFQKEIQQKALPQERNQVDPAVYAQFEQSLRSTKSEDIKKLKKSFLDKRDQAANFEEYKYYQKLLDIIEQGRK